MFHRFQKMTTKCPLFKQSVNLRSGYCSSSVITLQSITTELSASWGGIILSFSSGFKSSVYRECTRTQNVNRSFIRALKPLTVSMQLHTLHLYLHGSAFLLWGLLLKRNLLSDRQQVFLHCHIISKILKCVQNIWTFLSCGNTQMYLYQIACLFFHFLKWHLMGWQSRKILHVFFKVKTKSTNWMWCKKTHLMNLWSFT